MQRRCRNAPELLDAPNEYYYAQQTGRLFFYYNGTGKPKGELVATKLQTLIEFKGSQAEPIVNVTLSGLHFRDAAETGMEPHGVPSCGDWALQRMAAVFVEGSERLTVDGCSFVRIDGNALMLSKYNRHATISNSEFAFIGEHRLRSLANDYSRLARLRSHTDRCCVAGDNAMAAWGWTDELSANGTRGWDATAGDFPRHTTLAHNVVREVGLFEKQS